MKTTGILIPAFSTRRNGDLGIGDTLGMRDWIDWAAEHQVGFLQLLPINENGCDESPYSGISSAALDPIYLSFDPPEIPFISRIDVDAARASLGPHLSSHLIDYPAVRAAKRRLLEISFARFSAESEETLTDEFEDFRKQHESWLPDYCLFKLLIELNGEDLTWDQWPEESRNPESARKYVGMIREDDPPSVDGRLRFFAFIQWLCFRQWLALRAHADYRNVKLMGDVPIGISFHSADVFFNRSIFHVNWFAGTPPEGYSSDNPFIHEWGQNWGVPVYDWKAVADSGFAWWRARIAHLTGIFRIFRIDHILGFYRIYAFPWHPRDNARFLGLSEKEAAELTQGLLPRWFQRPDDTAENRAMNLAEGDFHLRAILEAAPDAEIIAEDLGWVPDYVRPHLAELGIAGYRIPHWDSRENGGAVMGDTFPENSFTSYSTHDHDSLCAIWENCRRSIASQRDRPTEQGHWIAQGSANALRLLAGFSGVPVAPDDNWPPYSDAIHWRLIKSLLESNSRYAVLMVTDLFALRDRINSPGTHGGNNWRLRLNLTADEMAFRGRILSNLISITGRTPPELPVAQSISTG